LYFSSHVSVVTLTVTVLVNGCFTLKNSTVHTAIIAIFDAYTRRTGVFVLHYKTWLASGEPCSMIPERGFAHAPIMHRYVVM